MSESVRDLLVRGIAAAKAKERKEARFYLEWALRMQPSEQQRIDAWFWLSEVSDDPAEERDCLEHVLSYQPNHYRARRRLAVLDGRLAPEEVIDPDRISQSPQETGAQISVQRFVCQTCGGRLTFTPDGQALTCEFCDSRQSLQTEGNFQREQAPERDFTLALATLKGHSRPVATPVFACQACGASFALSPGTLSLTCPYCSSIYVVEGFESRELLPPEEIIPFIVAEEGARKAIQDWLTGRGQEGRAKIGPLNGLYLPMWVFTISGEVTWSYLEYDPFRFRWVQKSGSKPVLFEEACIPACNTLRQEWMQETNSYSLRGLLPYDPAYLADFPAEIYQVSVADASLKARSQILGAVRASMDLHTSGQIKDFRLSSTGILVEFFKLILAPLWSTQIVYGGGRYPLYVNGQTAVVFGEAPAEPDRGWPFRLLKDR